MLPHRLHLYIIIGLYEIVDTANHSVSENMKWQKFQSLLQTNKRVVGDSILIQLFCRIRACSREKPSSIHSKTAVFQWGNPHCGFNLYVFRLSASGIAMTKSRDLPTLRTFLLNVITLRTHGCICWCLLSEV